MSDLSPSEAVLATADPIHDIGTMIYLSPETFARAAEWGWQNPFAFYFAGRAGVLGDVDASVATAALGWFEPTTATTMWKEGIAVHGVSEAAQRMLEATSLWGRDHLAKVDGLDRFVELAERVVDGAEGSGLPLFAAWRAQPRPDDAPARGALLAQTLREWRGAIHLVATTAVGLAPLEAILVNEGSSQARLFGWAEPFPDCAAVKHLRDDAQAMTDRLCAKTFASALTSSERGEFASAVAAVKAGGES